jgi:ribosome-associated toxin RatA of RatAB toxin-antitoxin module
MKQLESSVTGTTSASIEDCYATLSDFESYPRWVPSNVTAAEVLERDPASGHPSRIKTTLHVAQGPLVRDFKVHMAVTLQRPELIELRRLPKEPSDREEMVVTWRLRPAGGGTEVQASLQAKLSIPAFLPVGGIADTMARGFLDAALSQLGR